MVCRLQIISWLVIGCNILFMVQQDLYFVICIFLTIPVREAIKKNIYSVIMIIAGRGEGGRRVGDHKP